MIEIKNLTKSFGEKQIFKDFNYQIKDGVMLGIVGKSGCGKTTLLNMIGLLDNNFEGVILYNNVNISKQKENKRLAYIRNQTNYLRNTIGYLFQNYALIDDETVEKNLFLALENEKITKSSKIDRINKALEKVELQGYNNKKIYTLSGGEQQRVALARIILKKGNIVLADEPTGNLDAYNSAKVMHILKDLQKENKTIIIVTHNSEIANECDEILNLG